MINLATSISLYTSTSIAEAMALPVSVAEKVIACKSFDQWTKSKESEQKIQVAIINRLNDVIRGLGIVAKTISRTRRG
jgi:dimeric dUTPase (all-alpha-NTP-PPase superfamily)